MPDEEEIFKPDQVVNHYKIISIISKTKMSFVYSAINMENNKQVAIKIIPNAERTENEIKIMKSVDCKYVISAFDIFDYENYKCIVMPLAKTNVHKFLMNTSLPTNGLRESIIKNVVYNALKGLKYLHSNNICHRDIKTENLLMNCVDFENPFVILGDLGLATYFEDGKKLEEPVGTLKFAAPEIINHTPYDKSIDIWSLGVTTYFLLSGTYPFPNTPESCLRRCIQKGAFIFPQRIWKGISKTAQDFIGRMIQVNPKDRMTVDEALNHPWILNKQINESSMPASVSMPSFNSYKY